VIKIWQLIFQPGADKQFCKLSKTIQAKILDYFDDRILVTPDPYVFAVKLSGNDQDLWRFRVGDYRIICKVEKHKLIIMAVAIGHRKEIYKKIRH
jgi:mRNA interferase RelE/StbE